MPDLWDTLAIVGLSLIVAGVAAIFWPCGLILGGIALLVIYAVREVGYVPTSRGDESNESVKPLQPPSAKSGND